MGYRQQARVYRLVWEDGPFVGLEVRGKSLPVGAFLAIEGSQHKLQELITRGAVSEAEMQEVLEPVQRIVDAIVSWNIEDAEGRPVPVTLDGFMSLTQEEVTAILTAWANAGTNVSTPLERPSPDGELEASLPMAELPPSPGS